MNNCRRPLVPRHTPGRRNGVTLIEVMISIVLVSTILLVSLTASANLMRNNSERRNTNLGQQLASQILDEVSSVDFHDPTSVIFGLEPDESATDRTTFDDVDDYQGYTSSPPSHRDGTAIDGYEGWSFSVSIAAAEADANGITTVNVDAQAPLRLIAVVCTAPDGTTVDAGTLVSNVPSDINDTTSYEKWRRIKLTFPDREINVTAPLRNHPEPI